MPRIIPPFAALRAFEATGRLGRQSDAAEELHISTSAISHQIRALESFLGVPLFTRARGVLELSAEGRHYYERVCAALDILSSATEEKLSAVDNTPLKIHMFQSLANLWFVPSLQEFAQRAPDQRVIILTIPEKVSLAGSDIDALIVYSKGRPANLLVDLLFEEVMVPVCSPAFLHLNGPMDTVESILNQRLICSSTHVDEWREWARAVGSESEPRQPHLFFDNRANMLEAAREGLGLALDRRPYGEIQKIRGLLVEPLARPVATGWSYYLVTNERSRHSQGIHKMRDWLLGLCKAFSGR